MSNFTMPEKPKQQKDQVSELWNVVANCVLTQLRVQNLKLNFLIAIMGTCVALLGFALFKVFV